MQDSRAKKKGIFHILFNMEWILMVLESKLILLPVLVSPKHNVRNSKHIPPLKDCPGVLI